MTYYPEPDSHIRVEVALDLTNYATKKELNNAINDVNLAAKRDFIAEVDKQGINKLVNVPTGLNKLITKVDNLDVGKLKTCPVDLKKLSDVVSKEIVKSTKFNKLNLKVCDLETKIPDASTLIQTNQYNAFKQSYWRKILKVLRIRYLTLVV